MRPLLPVCVALLLMASLAQAQDMPPPDEVVMLPCDGKCAAITPPVGIREPRPVFPKQYTYGNYSEGFVQLEFTIGADGRVGDIRTVRLLGPEAFANSAKRAVQDWLYKPAMLDGEAVAISHPLLVYFSVIFGGQLGARPAIASAYKKASVLLADKKLEDANAILMEALKEPKLNLYERGMITNLTSLIAYERKDYVAARDMLDLTRFYQGKAPPDVLRSMLRTDIAASLSAGDLAEAVITLRALTRAKGFDPADPLIKLVADTRTRIDPLPSFAASARIPDAADSDGFTFTPYRRNFTFTNIVGKLDRYTLSCRERQVESPIAEKVDWHVPKNWSGCHLFIRGTPGTTFDIVQMLDAKPVTP